MIPHNREPKVPMRRSGWPDSREWPVVIKALQWGWSEGSRSSLAAELLTPRVARRIVDAVCKRCHRDIRTDSQLRRKASGSLYLSNTFGPS